MRVFLGLGMDRYGPTRVWLASLALFIFSALVHVAIGTVDGPAVYLARILMATGIAGAFGASLTYVSLRVPEPRIAEMVGTLGTSGFLGLALGPTLGDLLFHSSQITRLQIDRMFYLAACAGGVSWVLTYLATRKEPRRVRPRKQPPLLALIRRYHPGAILLVAAAMGLGVGLPHVFLRAYAAELQFAGIKTFFVVYAAVAFTVRLLTRRWSQRLGIRPMILLGLVAQTASMFLYLVVEQPWHLAIPATFAGIAHALLYPSVVAGGSVSFPSRYRGLATTLVLALFDIGNLFGQPAVGNALYYAGRLGLPKYSTMFVAVALTLALITAVYWYTSRTKPLVANPLPANDSAARGEVERGSSSSIGDGPADCDVVVAPQALVGSSAESISSIQDFALSEKRAR